MNAQTVDWSDIPYVLAVCEAGTLSGAARKLGVNHSTVFRRIESVEKKLGVILFERLNRGYVMTPAGEHFLTRGRSLHEGMTQIQRELGGKDLRLEGTLSITTTDSMLYRLSPMLQNFQNRYPAIELRLMSDTRSFDLMQRDADIAIRSTNTPPEHLIGRNLVPVDFAIYTHASYQQIMQDLPPEDHRWILLDCELGDTPMSRIAAASKHADAPVTTTNSVMSMYTLACSGLGIAAMPCYMESGDSGLIRLSDPDPAHSAGLWILSHPDVRRSARVHAFYEYASDAIRKEFQIAA